MQQKAVYLLFCKFT